MPAFGTSDLTRRNAMALMQSLGVTAEELDIRPAANRMLADIRHPFAEGKPVYDLTFENVQAGLRTDYLFRLANHHNGIVVGTGDLSELALGWCTYGVGDQMAHYNVNSGVPKTLIQHLIRWVIGSRQFGPDTLDTLGDILDTEISPELIPTAEGEAPQSTEATTDSPRRRSPFWRCRRGRMPSAATGRRIFRRSGAGRSTFCRSATGWRCSCAGSSRSASSSAAPCRTGRR
jgi:NAD+ synthase (glutamine-hydrolysing)